MDNKERLAQLVTQLQSGDKSAFSEIYKLTSPKAFYVAFEITKNEQDAEDILQESYITALDKIATLDKPESFVGWFHRIVANKSKDSLKKKKPTLFACDENEAFEVIPDEDTDFIPEESVDKSELQQIVMSVLDELSEDKRACVLMYYFEECSVNDIARTLDVPVSTVKNRLFTARKDLQGKFSKRGITSAYSVAPIGVVLWALRRTSESVAKGFIQSPASPKILAALTASTSSAAVAAGATGTAAVTTAASVATGTGVASKIAAMTLVQKIVAGATVVAVVTGSGFGVAAVIKNRNKEDTVPEKTTALTEEVTTAFYTVPETENVMLAITEPSTATLTDTSASTASTVAGSTATTKATTKPATTKPTTTKPKPTTTRPKATTTTQKATTTTRRTTTTTTRRATTTTTKKATTTTAKTTTTQPTTAAPAQLVIKINDGSGTPVETLTRTVPAGMTITEAYVTSIVEAAGYQPYGGVYADSFEFGVAAQSGVTYNASADT